ncbi:MAG: DUF4956 domain-containing protein [Erysipelotrichaceae bacterium]|nr:DUF4956 domain-containing protein [Erysipelotrichaceae bacterium]
MIDTIKELILNQFAGPVTVGMIVTSLIVAFICSLFIVIVYRKTFTGIVYNRTLPLTIIMLAMVVAMIIRTINSNLSLSLGMVGALSIVRFRTAIKEPLDTSFMFWAITAGIMSGAGLYIIAIIGSLLLGVVYYVSYMISAKAKSQYLLVVVYNAACEEQVMETLKSVTKKQLKSKSSNSQHVCELTYEIEYSKGTDALMGALQNIEGVRNVNLVSYNNEIGL